MESQNILLFHPVRDTWHALVEIRNRPIFQIVPSDSMLKKGTAFLANGMKRRLVEVVIAIATIFAFFYSLVTYSFRLHQATKSEEEGIELDLARFTPAERKETEEVVEAYFKKHEKNFAFLPSQERNRLIRRIVSQCARSQKVYGPIVRNWVDHLLARADQEGKKLVFMARDGIPYYKVATELMKKPEYKEKYPSLTKEGAISLGYFSRNVVAHAKETEENQETFKRYISDELKIQKGEDCIFADIGFSGSMIRPIRQMLPDNNIDFNFLVATSNLAEGFLGNPQKPLPHLETAANNLGVRWAEESHHGTLASATKLVVGTDNRVYPDTLFPKKVRCEEKFSTEYMIRKFCLRRLVSHAVNIPSLSPEEASKARDAFSDTIGKIKKMQLPMLLGWDY